MIHTINRTVTTIEPIEVELSLPAYFKDGNKIYALTEDEKIATIYRNGHGYYSLGIYEHNDSSYHSLKDKMLSLPSATEDEWFTSLEIMVKALKPKK